jgi:CRP-like cAMP-binding protein
MKAPKLNAVHLFRNIVEQFVSLTDQEWDVFKKHLHTVNLNKKESFVQAGEVCNYIGLITSGSVRYYDVVDGSEKTNCLSLENEMISSYKSFLTRKASKGYIEALEKTELITLSYRSMQELYANKEMGLKMERFGRLVAEYLCCCYEDRITSFITQSPEERYLDLLARSSNILQRIPQHCIANYLGITPVSLSRIRRRIMAPAKAAVLQPFL